MSKTTTYRFEVGNDSHDIGVIDYAKTFDEAVRIAQRFVEKENITAYIFDRMAHKDKPNLWDVFKCHGEVHANGFIDNCPECMPYFGVQLQIRDE